MHIIGSYHPMSSWLFLAGVCSLGLVIGTFLNLLIYRLPKLIEHDNHVAALQFLGHTLEFSCSFPFWQPRSFCLHCKAPLPILASTGLLNFLPIGSRKPCCHKIVRKFFGIELLTSGLSLLLASYFGPTFTLFFALILTWSLVALFFIDLDTFLLPDQITLPILWIGLFSNIFSTFTDPKNAVLGAIAGYVFFYTLATLVHKIKKVEGLGRGDCKLLALLGAWFGWESLPSIVLIASITGATYGVIQILWYKRKFNSLLPFGPFLSIAGLICLFAAGK